MADLVLSQLRHMLQTFDKSRSHTRIYPKTYEDVVQILHQANGNHAPVKAVGGTCHVPITPNDVLVDLRYINRLLGLDINNQTVKVESGIKMSKLSQVLETISLSLHVRGRVPDLSVCDAIAVGTAGSTKDFLSSIVSVDVVLPNCTMTTWNWDKNPKEMQALCCGLGMVAIVLSVTIKCVPLIRCLEVSYIGYGPIHDILETWAINGRSSIVRALFWFPFSELTIMSYMNEASQRPQLVPQTSLNYVIEKCSDAFAQALRSLSLLSWRHLPMIASFLSRVQFFAQWAVQKHRSDFLHNPISTRSSIEYFRGTTWILPSRHLNEVICEVSTWAQENPHACCYSPMVIQIFRSTQESQLGDRTPDRHKIQPQSTQLKPYLLPEVHDKFCTVWYDWFAPENEPNPVDLASFEEIFESRGAKRCWQPGRLTSPLALHYAFPANYERFCSAKTKLDKNLLLDSGYLQGTILSAAIKKR